MCNGKVCNSNSNESHCEPFVRPIRMDGESIASMDDSPLQTRAVSDGADYVINGQKIWTSYARHAEYCFLMARTDPDVPKHKGISVFLLDMKTPGVTVRPIDSLGGPIEFHELFFDGALSGLVH